MRKGEFSKGSTKNKKTLLQLAKKGADRPAWGSVLMTALRNYTSGQTTAYDPKFREQIFTLRPDWLPNARESLRKNARIHMAEKKNTLLDIIQNNRPVVDKAIFEPFIRSDSKYYEPEFHEMVRAAYPKLFERKPTPSSIKGAEKKKALLADAARGCVGPVTLEDRTNLRNYTYNRSLSYDPVFRETLMTIAPHWLSDKQCYRKQKIIEMIKSGETLSPSYQKTFAKFIVEDARFSEEIIISNLHKLYPEPPYGSNHSECSVSIG
jgi:hypothetical protein